MGAFDSVSVPCPKCGIEQWFQSKGSENAALREFNIYDCPADVMSDINRHSPYRCAECGTSYAVKFKLKVVKCKPYKVK